jgi:hypothetical protein
VEATSNISKYNETATNTLKVYMLHLRLKEVTTDLLVTFYFPMNFAEGSSSAGKEATAAEDMKAITDRAVSSFRIKSMSIFGE